MFMLGTIFLPGQALAERGLKVPLRASETPGAAIEEEVQLYGSSYALVVGIDNYTNGWPRLSNAIADAQAIAKELKRKGFNVMLKTDLKSVELEQVFKTFFIDKGGDPDARLFVWFAGHGHTENGEGFLIPADAPRPEVGRRFKFAALPMRRFGEYVRLAESKHAFAVFDSCFSGTVFEGARALPPAAVTRATTLPVRQFLTSGDAGQTVSDDGTFRKLFLRALRGEERVDANGDGFITASEMGLFLGDRITNLTQSKQTPRYGKLRDVDWDRGDFVFSISKASLTSTTTTSGNKTQTNTTPEMMFWQSIQGSANPDEYQAYLQQYPNGAFAALAKLKLKSLAPRQVARRTTPEEPEIRAQQPPIGSRAFLGVNIKETTNELAKKLKLAKARGAYVHTIHEGKPAALAGIKAEDIILSFNRKEISHYSDLPRLVGLSPPGARIELEIWRDGRNLTLPVTLGILTAEQLAEVFGLPGELGIRIVPGYRGLEIVSVGKDSDAARKGLEIGDLLTTVEDKSVATGPETEAALNAAKETGKGWVQLKFRKPDGRELLVSLNFAPPEPTPAPAPQTPASQPQDKPDEDTENSE